MTGETAREISANPEVLKRLAKRAIRRATKFGRRFPPTANRSRLV
jgi:hypothetical protein